MASILKVDQLQSDTGTINFASNVAFTGTQAITIPGNLNLTGGGIKFPSTQVPSADGNTLDDYEEGTWTCTITPGGGSITPVTGQNVGYYVKIGRVVYINLWWRKGAETSPTGDITLSGFPFAFSSDATNVARQRVWASGYNFVSLSNRSAGWLVPVGGASTASLFFIATDYATGQSITAGNFAGASTEVYINGFYMTD